MRLPSSLRKSIRSYCLLMAPIVSAATGTNKYGWVNDKIILVCFPVGCRHCCYAWSLGRLVYIRLGHSKIARLPAVRPARTDGKRLDGVTLLPWKQRNCVTWDVTVSDTLAQSYAGMSAFAVARHTRSFRLWCFADRPLSLLHDRPCNPLESTGVLRGHWWGSHMLAPSIILYYYYYDYCY